MQLILWFFPISQHLHIIEWYKALASSVKKKGFFVVASDMLKHVLGFALMLI